MKLQSEENTKSNVYGSSKQQRRKKKRRRAKRTREKKRTLWLKRTKKKAVTEEWDTETKGKNDRGNINLNAMENRDYSNKNEEKEEINEEILK